MRATIKQHATSDGTNAFVSRDLILKVTLREQLASRCPPASRVLECPSTDCVGVGYSGQQTAMCFICETSWNDPDYGVVSRVWNWVKGVIFPETIDGVHGWRPCPHCGAAILKDGGCNNMRCGYCDQVFLWGPFRNTVAGEIAAAWSMHSTIQPGEARVSSFFLWARSGLKLSAQSAFADSIKGGFMVYDLGF